MLRSFSPHSKEDHFEGIVDLVKNRATSQDDLGKQIDEVDVPENMGIWWKNID